MKRTFLMSLVALMALIGIANKATAQMPLSPTATASLLTCGPGTDFYTSFGHSALRITDTARGIDLVYNYGTFDFDTPHFYWQFMRGKLNYCLSRTTFPNFIAEYIYEGRSVSSQQLNLSHQELCNLYLLLEQNYLPEYRYYKYDFFRDNCATRIRDMVHAAASHWEFYYSWSREGEYSYRDLIRFTLRDSLDWWRLGIDMLFGLPADHRVTTEECMFLPDWMEALFSRGYCDLRNYKQHESKRLSLEREQLLPYNHTPLSRSVPPSLVFALLLAAIGALSFLIPHSSFLMRSIDRTLFILAGLIGCFLLFMWLGTDHWCTKWNLNILWASPMLLLIALRLERSPRWALWMQEACFLVAALWVLSCHLSFALFLLISLLALRVAMQIKQRKTD